METQPAQPIIAQTKTPSSSKFTLPPVVKKLLPLIILAALVIAGVVVGINFFKNRQSGQSTDQVGQILPLTGGEIAIVSEKTDYRVGEVVPVVVKVSTGGYTTLGTDLVLKYDPNILEIAGAQNIVNGDAYNEYPAKTFDQQQGMVGISGISSINSSGFNGIATFATINFRAKSAGKASLKVEFTPGGTAESNIIRLGDDQSASEDILAKVSDLELIIK